MNKYISTNYRCAKCQKQYEFSVNNNIRGIKQYKCKHFLLKFISNLDNNALIYMVSIKCLKCNKIQKKTLAIANHPSMKDFNSNIFQCCKNQISLAAFYSEIKLESINFINNLVQDNAMNNNINNFNMNNKFNMGFNNLNQMSNINQNQNNFNFQNVGVGNNNFINQNMNNLNANQNFNNIAMNGTINFSNINMGQNIQFMNNNRMNVFQTNSNMNNLNLNNNVINNNCNNFQMMNNNQFDNIYAAGQNELNSYANLRGEHINFGQAINFNFSFKQVLYPVYNVKNDRIFKDVLNEFLNNYPEIKNHLSPNQRYSVSGNIIDINLNLFENDIREKSQVLIHWTGDY